MSLPNKAARKHRSRCSDSAAIGQDAQAAVWFNQGSLAKEAGAESEVRPESCRFDSCGAQSCSGRARRGATSPDDVKIRSFASLELQSRASRLLLSRPGAQQDHRHRLASPIDVLESTSWQRINLNCGLRSLE